MSMACAVSTGVCKAACWDDGLSGLRFLSRGIDGSPIAGLKTSIFPKRRDRVPA
jgi:hypothetical protein